MHTSTYFIYLKVAQYSIMRYTLYKGIFNITILVTIIPEDLEASGLLSQSSILAKTNKESTRGKKMKRPEVLPFSKHLTWISDLPVSQQWVKAVTMGSVPATLKETLALMLMKLFFTELTESGNDDASRNCDYSWIS